jgi:hypothetical protein
VPFGTLRDNLFPAHRRPQTQHDATAAAAMVKLFFDSTLIAYA